MWSPPSWKVGGRVPPPVPHASPPPRPPPIYAHAVNTHLYKFYRYQMDFKFRIILHVFFLYIFNYYACIFLLYSALICISGVCTIYRGRYYYYLCLSGDVKKSRSFASKLKGRFHRGKKSRSQSADRASSVREGSLLRPPNNQHHLQAGSRTAGSLQTFGLVTEFGCRNVDRLFVIFLEIISKHPLKWTSRVLSQPGNQVNLYREFEKKNSNQGVCSVQEREQCYVILIIYYEAFKS